MLSGVKSTFFKSDALRIACVKNGVNERRALVEKEARGEAMRDARCAYIYIYIYIYI